VTAVECVLMLVTMLAVFAALRLHAELVVVRKERDDALRQLKALVTVYRKGVDNRRDAR
jgi:hypothetical protein